MDLETILKTMHYAEPEVKIQVMGFLRGNTSVEEKSLDFITAITRVANHMLKVKGYDERRFLERVYDIYETGVDKLRDHISGESCTGEGNRSDHKRSIPHMMLQQADFARHIFLHTQENSWLERWYQKAITSAGLAKETDANYAIRGYNFAGKAAFSLFDRTGDVEWGKRWYSANIERTKVLTQADKLESARSFQFAANAAKKLYKLTGNMMWAERAYESNIESAKRFEDEYPHEAENAYGYAAIMAKEIFSRSNVVGWGIKAYEANKASSKVRGVLRWKVARYNLFAGELAQKLFDRTGDKSWAEKAHACYSVFISNYGFKVPQRQINYVKMRMMELADVLDN